jgi:hypothetical protein
MPNYLRSSKLVLIASLLGLQSVFALDKKVNDKIQSNHNGFIENSGQIIDQHQQVNSSVRYLLSTKGLNMQLRSNGFSYDLWKPTAAKKGAYQLHRIDFNFINANPALEIVTSKNALASYRYGQAQLKANAYADVTYKNVWKNIDIVFHENNGKPKYDFVVKSGAKLTDIAFAINGAQEFTAGINGLVIKNSIATITESIPASFLTTNGSTKKILVNFDKKADGTIGFKTNEEIPENATLIIDPTPNRLWATYLGGVGYEEIFGTSIATSGDIFVTGQTSTISYTATTGAVISSVNGAVDAFVAKYNVAGNLIWFKYFGGTDFDYATAISKNITTSLVIAGYTTSSTGLASTGNVFGGGNDAFVAKIDTAGLTIWSRYYGDAGDEQANGVAVSTDGSVYVGGLTTSTLNIATAGTQQTAYGAGAGVSDGFIAKFNGATGATIWGTYLGGTGDDAINGIATDATNNVYVVGNTTSTNNIASTIPAAQQAANAGLQDAFLVKYAAATGVRSFGTYMGGTFADGANAVSIDALSNVFVGGYTNSPLLATAGTYKSALGTGQEAILVKYNSTSGLRIAATYFGGTGNDEIKSINSDAALNIVIAGSTNSPNAIATVASFQNTYSNALDGFVVRLNNALSTLQWGTYLGATGNDIVRSVAVGNNVIAAGGYTNSSAAIATANGNQQTYGGNTDGMLVYIDALGCVATTTPSVNTSICSGDSLTINANTGTGFHYIWLVNGAASINDTLSTIKIGSAGTYAVQVTNAIGCVETSNTITISLNALPTATITASGSTTICNGTNVVLNANTGTGLSYQWYKDSVLISGATASTYTATLAGNYMVKVTNSSNCFAYSSPIAVVVIPLPTASIGLLGSATICAGDSTELVATNGTGFSFQWNLNGTPISGATNQNYFATASGSYTCTVTANGCSKTSTAKLITVNAAPAAIITPLSSPTFCFGGSVTLSANLAAGNSYVWRKNGVIITGAFGSNYTTNTAGSYTVTITNANNCTATSAPTIVTVNPIPTVSIVNNNTNPICPGDTVTFTATASTTVNYQWLKNGAVIASNGNDSIYKAFQAGWFKVVVVDANGCQKTSDSLQVQLLTPPPATITPAVAAICQNDSTLLTANAGTGLSYQWNLNGTPISSATNQTLFVNVAGAYTVKVTNAIGCSATSAQTNITVNALPTTTITPGPSLNLCTGDSIILHSPIAAGNTYQWYQGGVLLPGETKDSLKVLAGATYTVKITNSFGCKDSSSGVVVTQYALPTVSISPNITTYLCAGDSLLYTASGTGLTSYQWYYNGSAITSNGNGTTYMANVAGYYQVAATNSIGCIGKSTIDTLIFNPLPVLPTANTPINYCYGSTTAQLTATATGSNTLLWFTAATGGVGSPTAPIPSNTVSATYYVAQVTPAGCIGPRLPIVVNVQPQATFTSTLIDSVCSGMPYSYTPLPAPTATLIYTWIRPSVPNISNAAVVTPINNNINETLINTSANPVNVTYIYTINNSGCVNTVNLVVKVKPTPTLSNLPNNPTICSGVPYIYTPTSATAGTTFQWTRAAVIGISNPGVTVPVVGGINETLINTFQVINPVTYSYQLNAAGCINTIGFTLTVNPTPISIATAAGPTTFCAGGSVVLNDSTNLTTGFTYTWKNGTNIVGTASSFTATAAGVYTCTVTNTATGCQTVSNAITVVVNPIPTMTLNTTTPLTFCPGGSVVLNASPTTGVTYQWYKNSNLITGASASTYTATQSGSYTVVGTYPTGCFSNPSTAKVVLVDTPYAIIAPVGNVNLCSNEVLTATANTGTGFSYQWYLNGVAIPVATASSYTISQTAVGSTFPYTVKVTNATGCFTTSSALNVTVVAIPTVSIVANGPTTFCFGNNVLLTSTATGVNITYQWKFNGTDIPGATASSYYATTTGTYTCQVSNINNCKVVSNGIPIINNQPVATINNTTSLTFCNGDSVILYGNSGVVSYQWNLNGAPIPGATNQNYVAYVSGSYTLTTVNSSNCIQTSSPKVVNAVNAPIAVVAPSGPTSFCQGLNVTLTANTGVGYTYQWLSNGVPIAGATAIAYTTGNAGNYSVVVKNANNCSTVSSVTVVTTYANPTVTIAAAGSTNICNGDSVLLSSTATPGVTYQWYLGNVPIVNATSSNFMAKVAGVYTVKVTNVTNCSTTSSSITLTVKAGPTAYITYNTPLTFCDGSLVVLTAVVGSNTTYQWRKNGVAIPGSSAPSYNATQTGTYTLFATNTLTGCSANSTAVQVVVFPITIPIIVRNGIVFSTTTTYASYQWLLNSVPIPGATAQTYTAVANGTYRVKVKDANGCESFSDAEFLYDLGVNNNASLATQIKLYPNPTDGVVHIDAPMAVQITVRDYTGKIVIETENTNLVDLTNFADGMYMVFLNDLNGNFLKVEKLMKSTK